MTPSRTRCSRPTAGCRRRSRDDEKVLVVVMTDGLENSSTDYDAVAVAELVRRYDERPNWTFVYLGAGHESIDDAQQAAMQLGYRDANAMLWSADHALRA